MQMLLSSSTSSSSPLEEAVNAIFIAHTLRKTLQLSFQKWFIRNTVSLLKMSDWRNVRKENCLQTVLLSNLFSVFKMGWMIK